MARKEVRFSHRGVSAATRSHERSLDRAPDARNSGLPCRSDGLRKTPLLSQLFLCLSRACHGKMIVLMYKWRKKWRFSHRIADRSHATPPAKTKTHTQTNRDNIHIMLKTHTDTDTDADTETETETETETHPYIHISIYYFAAWSIPYRALCGGV